MHRIAALFVVMLLALSGGGNFADPVPATPVPVLPLPGTPQPPDPLGGFRGLQPTPAAVTPSAPNTSRFDVPDPESTAEFGATPTPGFPDSRPETRQSSEPNDGEAIEIVPFGDTDRLRAELADPGTEIIYLMPDAAQTPFLIGAQLVIAHDVEIFGNNAVLRGSVDRSTPLIHVLEDATVTMHHVHIQHGRNVLELDNGGGYGGGLLNTGNLTLYDSSLTHNAATFGGGAILNAGTLRVIRTTIQNNWAGGGAGIQNDQGNDPGTAQLTVECSRFIGNGADVGAGIYNGDTWGNAHSDITVRYSAFTNNTAQIAPNAADIHNLLPAATTLVDARGNWWGADGVADVSPDNVQIVDEDEFVTVLAEDPTVIPHQLPECRPRSPRLVDSNSVALNVMYRQLGLPMPFQTMPYQDLSLQNLGIWGYGPNSFASKHYVSNYCATYGIHPGLDYQHPLGCSTPSTAPDDVFCNESVTSLCHGVIIRGRMSSGGSASGGDGISVRCFDDSRLGDKSLSSVTLTDFDTDNDGNPNLSNMIITYNHLHSVPNTLYQDVSGVGSVVSVGDLLGYTGAHAVVDHLHLELYLARGYESGSGALVLNPLQLYSTSLLKLHDDFGHWIRPYYPIVPSWQNRDPVDQVYEGPPQTSVSLGIFAGDLDKWSQGGNRARGYKNPDGSCITTQIFWSIQTPYPTTIVEWHEDLLISETESVSNDEYTSSLLEFVSYLYPPDTNYRDTYLAEFGVSPNCVEVPGFSPVRVDCPRADLISAIPQIPTP